MILVNHSSRRSFKLSESPWSSTFLPPLRTKQESRTRLCRPTPSIKWISNLPFPHVVWVGLPDWRELWDSAGFSCHCGVVWGSVRIWESHELDNNKAFRGLDVCHHITLKLKKPLVSSYIWIVFGTDVSEGCLWKIEIWTLLLTTSRETCKCKIGYAGKLQKGIKVSKRLGLVLVWVPISKDLSAFGTCAGVETEVCITSF